MKICQSTASCTLYNTYENDTQGPQCPVPNPDCRTHGLGGLDGSCYEVAADEGMGNVGALMVRIGFGGIIYYDHNREPSK